MNKNIIIHNVLSQIHGISVQHATIYNNRKSAIFNYEWVYPNVMSFNQSHLIFLDVFYVCGLSEFMWCIFIFLDSDWKIWIQISWDHISLPRSGEMRRHIRVQGSSIGGSKKTMGGYWLASSFFFLKTVFSPVNLYLVP